MATIFMYFIIGPLVGGVLFAMAIFPFIVLYKAYQQTPDGEKHKFLQGLLTLIAIIGALTYIIVN